MARQRRLSVPNAYYHIIARGINVALIFKKSEDRTHFLDRLAQGLEKTSSQCHAWALMSNHVHLLIHITAKPLSALMRRMLTGYALYFNHKYRRRGYLFQNRYKSILCDKESYLLELVRYIHLNPVRAGIVKSMDKLETYPWTGHSALMGKIPRTWQTKKEVLAYFGVEKDYAVKQYKQFVVSGWAKGKDEELETGIIKRCQQGWQQIKEGIEYWRGDERILGEKEFIEEILHKSEEIMSNKVQGWNLENLADRVCEILEIEKTALKKKGRQNKVSYAKGLIAFWGKEELGIKCSEIARYLNMTDPALIKAYERGKRYLVGRKVKLIS